MKDLKKKLTAAAAMLVVSAVMLSGVSYAWYTLSTNPEVKGITATATANANLEIAYNELPNAPQDSANNAGTTGKYDTYGNIVVMDDSTSGTTASQAKWRSLDKVLRPMTYTVKGTSESTDPGFQYMTYGNDGRPSTLSDLTITSVADSNNACGNIQLTESNKKAVDYGYFVRYWMRTNANKNNKLQLSTAVTRSKDKAAQTGGGTTITLEVTDQSTIDATSVNELIKHVRLGFSKTTAVQTGVTIIDPKDWTATDATENSKKATLEMNANTDTGITLNQNEDAAVYMYVYLDGTTMGNKLADALADGSVKISVNTQFSIHDMDDQQGMTATGE